MIMISLKGSIQYSQKVREWEAPEESHRVYQPKHCDKDNDEEIIPEESMYNSKKYRYFFRIILSPPKQLFICFWFFFLFFVFFCVCVCVCCFLGAGAPAKNFISCQHTIVLVMVDQESQSI